MCLSYAYRWQIICLVYNVTSLEKKMATHSSILAWEIPWTEESGGLQFMGLQSQTRHDWATVSTVSPSICHEVMGHGTIDWFQRGKGVLQGCILSPCLFNLYAEYIMGNTGLEEAQAEIKIARTNINNLRYADDTTLMAESEEELKTSWCRWKRRLRKLA